MSSNISVWITGPGREPSRTYTTTTDATITIEEIGENGATEIVMAGSIEGVMRSVKSIGSIRRLLEQKEATVPSSNGRSPLTIAEQAILRECQRVLG